MPREKYISNSQINQNFVKRGERAVDLSSAEGETGETYGREKRSGARDPGEQGRGARGDGILV